METNQRTRLTVTAESVLAVAEQVAADALTAAAARDWRTANDGLLDSIRDLCAAARPLPGHGPLLAAGLRFLVWDAEADEFRLSPRSRDALHGDAFLAAAILGGTK